MSHAAALDDRRRHISDTKCGHNDIKLLIFKI